MNQEANFVKLPDGRCLAYAEFGDPNGLPVIYCHGFPGSRLEAGLFDTAAVRHGLRVIAPDRNGLGLSDPRPGRRLIDWAEDVEILTDRLAIGRFSLIGVSGGGPYASACAYRLAERLSSFTLVCPLGPLDQPGLLDAMHWPAQINFRSIRLTPWLSNLSFRLAVIPLAQHSPQWIYQIMLGIAPAIDAEVLKRPAVRRVVTASLSEAIRQGADGVLHEMALYNRPWGFDLAEISTPVHLWHGSADTTVPLLHGRTMAEHLSDCTLHVVEGAGHFSLPVDHMEKILQRLIDEGEDQTL
jgi:pimeloyl-ACP methyl ester carboxylesterase